MDRRHLCRRCGVALEPEAERCPECGAWAADAPEPPPPNLPSCPQCHQRAETASAAVARLSALPDDHDPAVETEDAYFRRQSLLFDLAPPEEPTAFSLGTWILVLFVPVVNVLSLFVAPLTVGLRLFIGAMALWFVVAVARYAGGDFADPFAARDAAMTVGTTTFLLYLVALLHSWVVERREVAARLIPAYRRRRERWDRLAYCNTCDLAFLDDGTPVDLEHEVASTVPSRSARTPLWLWVVLAGLAVGGIRTSLRMAPWNGTAVGPAQEGPPPSPGLWEDIQPDAVDPGSTPTPDALSRPLTAPPGPSADSTGD